MQTFQVLRQVKIDSLYQSLKKATEEDLIDQLESYNSLEFNFEDSDFEDSGIAFVNQPVLLSADPKRDCEDAIKLYEFLKINRQQAFDPRFWVTLCHRDFKNYIQGRWVPAKQHYEQDGLKKRQELILRRYFFKQGHVHDLRYNGLSRLWWSVELTKDSQQPDPYFYTRILFTDSSIWQQIIQRKIARSNSILKTVLQHLKESGLISDSKKAVRVLEELDIVLALNKIHQNQPELKQTLKKITQTI